MAIKGYTTAAAVASRAAAPTLTSRDRPTTDATWATHETSGLVVGGTRRAR